MRRVTIADPDAIVANGIGRARIFDAVGDDRPAIVGAAFDDVDLIAALRADIGVPQHAASIKDQTFRAAQAISPDFRALAGFVEEGIVARRRAVWRDVDDFS